MASGDKGVECTPLHLAPPPPPPPPGLVAPPLPPPPPGSAQGAEQKPGSPRSLHAAMRRELHERFKQVFANHVPVWMQPHPGVDITPNEELLSPERSDVHMEEKTSQVLGRARGHKPITVKRALLASDMNVEMAITLLGDYPTLLSLNNSDLNPNAGVTLIRRVADMFHNLSHPPSLSSPPLASISFSSGRRSFSMQGGAAGHPDRTSECKESRGEQGRTGATRGDQAVPAKSCCSHAARRPDGRAPMRRAAGTRSHAHDHAGLRVQTAQSAARRDAQPQSACDALRRDGRRHPSLQQPRGPLSPHRTQLPLHSEFRYTFIQEPKSRV
jgi:hypothetical protein